MWCILRNIGRGIAKILLYLQSKPKKLQTIQNNQLLEFQWPSTNLQVKSAKY